MGYKLRERVVDLGEHESSTPGIPPSMKQETYPKRWNRNPSIFSGWVVHKYAIARGADTPCVYYGGDC